MRLDSSCAAICDFAWLYVSTFLFACGYVLYGRPVHAFEYFHAVAVCILIPCGMDVPFVVAVCTMGLFALPLDFFMVFRHEQLSCVW